MKMGPADYILIGMAVMAALYFLVLAIRKTWRLSVSMDEALRAVPAAVTAVQNLVDVARDFQKELTLMRAYANGQIPASDFGPTGEDAIAANRTPPSPVPYPAPIFDRFKVKEPEPDAELGDTEVIDQPDSEMAELEKFGALVDLGLAEAEPQPHVAREVDSK